MRFWSLGSKQLVLIVLELLGQSFDNTQAKTLAKTHAFTATVIWVIMILRRFLLLVPAAVLLILLQASAWVPRYGNTQNSTRLDTFIEASSGDARLLNPILHADTSSSRIVDLVFDGLLKIGDDLTLQAALAKSWSIREEAYLLVDPSSEDPSGVKTLREIQSSLSQPQHRKLAQYITDIQLSSSTTLTLAPLNSKDSNTAVTLRLPVRIKFSLNQVVPELLSDLQSILGDQYGKDIQREQLVVGSASAGWTNAVLKNKLPLLEHNPIIQFDLRTDVRFHDGARFDAEDVEFTYKAIMTPGNLSPIRSNFEPIKTLRVLNPHRLEVIYKR
jgi:ABC-type transport system substrate-binding protein